MKEADLLANKGGEANMDKARKLRLKASTSIARTEKKLVEKGIKNGVTYKPEKALKN